MALQDQAKPTGPSNSEVSIAPVPVQSRKTLLAVVIEAIPFLTGAVAVELVELLALAILDAESELTAIRTELLVALTLAHEQHVEMVRLRKRLVALLDEASERHRDRRSDRRSDSLRRGSYRREIGTEQGTEQSRATQR